MTKRVILFLFTFLLFFCINCKNKKAEIPSAYPAAPSTTETAESAFLLEPSEKAYTVSTLTQEPIVSEPQEAPGPAQRIRDVSYWVELVNVTKALNDDIDTTRIDFHSGRNLALESSAPFSAIYFLWDTIPGNYTVTWDDGSLECGKNDFLHEYIQLPEEVTSLVITFHEDSHIYLSGIRLYTAGAVPEDVQQWLPPCESADILVFPTHSDDDCLFFGALISQYKIQEELTVQTAFMVRHEWKERVHERLNGLWEMGIRHYPILGTMQDSGTHSMETVAHLHKKDDLKGWQVEQIRRFKPLVIVGHDLEGEYGNGQHKLNAHYLTQAVEMAADPSLYQETAQLYGVWDTPKLYLHLYEKNSIVLDVNSPMQKDAAGRTPFEVAEDAYAHHHSQHQFPFYVSQNDYESGMDCTRFGLYRSLVGTDEGTDIMEHIDKSKWR